LTNWSTTTSDTASGRSAFFVSCAALIPPAEPAPSVANTSPSTEVSLIGSAAAIPQATAGITTTLSTTIATTSQTRRSGATSSATVNVIPSERTVAPTETTIPALKSAVSS
jgi:hypothetical protein